MKDHDKELFDQLLPLYEQDAFDAVLAELTPNDNASERLITKMEVRRLTSPCSKPVDLRGKVVGDCRRYFLHDVNHWMDDVAINLYHRRVDIYQGKMTVGLWEELHNTPNSYRVLQRQGDVRAMESPDTVDAVPIRFGHYLSRSENRIHLSTRIQAFLPDGTEVNGSTIDISNSGMQVKLPSSFRYEAGSTLVIYFPQLGDECQLAELFSGLNYRVVGVELNLNADNFQRLRLRLMSSTDVIKEAIEIKSRKHNLTSKTENEDKFLSTRSRAYEQVFLEQTPSLPLFFCGHKLRYSLLTEQNKELWDYWHDERNQPVIDKLFSAKRLQYLALEGLTNSETLVYCFNHQQGEKTYFFSACPTELDEALRHLFWHVGSSRPSWRVLRVTMAKISEEDARRLQEVSPAYIQQIDELTHIATIQDLTLSHISGDFRIPIKPKHPVKQLNQFAHPRDPILPVEAVPSVLAPQRKEPRYQHKTKTTLVHHLSGELQGRTIDFSTQGLNVVLDKPFTGSKQQEVAITFTDLTRVDPKAPLGNVPYKVVQISEDRTNIKLALLKDRRSKQRSHYLQRLIEHNQHKLLLDSERLPDAPLLHAMHQMLLTRLSATPYFIVRRDETLQVSAIGESLTGNELSRLLQKNAGSDMMSLRSVIGDHLSKYANPVTRHRNREAQVRHEFYISATVTDGAIVDSTSRPLESFGSPEERKMFISQARRRGKFFAVRNWLQPIDNGIQWLAPETLESLLSLSTLRARQLEMEFADLCAYGEMSDITDEVLRRLEIGG
ncbi:PilZ domain-containing protein [Grimontia marina]|uniref:PilZ domain protein n=1 Tax=Grimontia marina TaxID=646534 RepID=A0A128ETR3_9GAMM|nr:PilZ domain-containing protein [Grimontia marina]CZF77953.1 PilZ domain protein [Grimontia marina]